MDKIIIVGLGYVGLPLAVEFGKIRPVIGFDTNTKRIAELKKGIDKTNEVCLAEINEAKYLKFTSDVSHIKNGEIYIITVPTPIDNFKNPDLSALKKATETVGTLLKKGTTVIYESTVFPGATEEICVPILEETSSLNFNEDFFCGYSPERINPGDKDRRLADIIKVTSGSTPKVAKKIDQLYSQIIKAGTFKTTSIKVAEAAKVIENTQRDLNIALVNELAQIFSLIDIDTDEVLNAAASKWNFIKFTPGLVGGHCIGVDPYYLTHKAESLGHHPQLILSGRRINDRMPQFVAARAIKKMISMGIFFENARVLILGMAFKSNCPDIRNTRIVDLHHEFSDYGFEVDIYDPVVDANDVLDEYDIKLINLPRENYYNLIIIAVEHEIFVNLDVSLIRAYGIKDKHVLFDLKSAFSKDLSDLRL